jgi:preprotein translocase subunit YajC
MLIFVALLLAVFPFLPVQLLRKQREERQEQEISRDLDE